MLEDAVTEMQVRAARFAGKHRDHTPTVEHPFVVVLVDEVALLTAYLPDRQLRDRVKAALATLTTQGRAVGFCVIAALQDPRKEVIDHTAPHPPAPTSAGPPDPAAGTADAAGPHSPGTTTSTPPSRPAPRSPSPGTQPAAPEPAARPARTTSAPASAHTSAAPSRPPPARPSTGRYPAAGPPAAAEPLPQPAAGSAPNPPLRSPSQSVWMASFSSGAMASFSGGADNQRVLWRWLDARVRAAEGGS
jgi:hypothetical protein